MPMDNDFHIDVDEIIRTLQSADVVTIRFHLFDKRVLIDSRTNEIDGPMVKIVDRVGSAEERFRSLRRLRPRFKLPERLTAIWWPKYVDTLETTGIWRALEERMAESGFPDSVRDCSQVIKDLRVLERQEIRNAIKGNNYETRWSRSSA
jgi:hypothetical protein